METEPELGDISPWRERRLWVPMGLVLIWGIWDLCVARFFNDDFQTIAAWLAFGPFYGQPALVALWGAWGPGRAMVRWPVAFGLVVLQAVCCTIDGDILEVLVALTISFVSCFVLLLIGRRVTGWSMHHGDGKVVTTENGRYGVRYLLGLTTFVALLAGVAKATDAVGGMQSETMDASELAVMALIIVLLTTPVVLLFIVTLMTGARHVMRLFAVFLIGVVATLVIALIMHLQWGESVLESFSGIGTLIIGASASVGISAAALRWAGYRVGRKQGTSEVGAGGTLEETT